MEGLKTHENDGLPRELAVMPDRCNKLWGTEYILMDSHSFMGKKGEGQYEKIIDIFVKAWNDQK